MSNPTLPRHSLRPLPLVLPRFRGARRDGVPCSHGGRGKHPSPGSQPPDRPPSGLAGRSGGVDPSPVLPLPPMRGWSEAWGAAQAQPRADTNHPHSLHLFEAWLATLPPASAGGQPFTAGKPSGSMHKDNSPSPRLLWVKKRKKNPSGTRRDQHTHIRRSA